MDKPTAALLLTFLVHVIGMAALVWLAFEGESVDWRRWWPRGGDDGGGGSPRAGEPDGPRDGGLPRPEPSGLVFPDDAVPARVRLRTEHERGPGAPRRERRPAREPEPDRPREPV